MVTWPPRTEDVVTISGKVGFDKRKTIPIYKVPPGRTLAVTKVLLDPNHVDEVNLRQRLGGKDLPKVEYWMLQLTRSYLFSFSACSVPVTFQAGSLVVLGGRRKQRKCNVRYPLRGYLTDQ